MRAYEKPIVVLIDEMAEGIYAASGSTGGGNGSTENKVCDSIYIKGQFTKSDYSDWQNGTNINGRGCEGCPANWSDGRCHVESYAASEDCRPSWEKQGKLPNDKWNQ